MKKAIYPGSFDPVTYGHIDIIQRAAEIFDELLVAVLNNTAKTPLFSVDERVNILKEVVKDIPNVTVLSYEGLLVDFAMANDAGVIRGKDSFIWGSGADASQTKTAGKVNINTADLAALQTLPGVGEATARAIIDYRSKNPFKKPDDLKKVSGIGDAKYERVKAFITV